MPKTRAAHLFQKCDAALQVKTFFVYRSTSTQTEQSSVLNSFWPRLHHRSAPGYLAGNVDLLQEPTLHRCGSISAFTFNCFKSVSEHWLHFLEGMFFSSLFLWHHKGYMNMSPISLPVATFYWTWVYQKCVMSVHQLLCLLLIRECLGEKKQNVLEVSLWCHKGQQFFPSN